MEIIFNHLRAALRNFLRHRTHAVINIAGLAVGLASILLILLYVGREWSTDRFHTKGDRIYLLPMVWHFGETAMPTAANCSGGGPFMKATFPEVEESVRIVSSSLSLRKGAEPIKESSVYFADESFFRVFTFPLASGDAETALGKPNSIVLTRAMTKKYFGDDSDPSSVLGKTLTTTANTEYVVTGVVDEVPENSHLRFDFLASITSLQRQRIEPSWNNSEFYTYLLLTPGASGADLKLRIKEAQVKVFGEELARVVELDLLALRNVYLHNPTYPVPNGSDIFYVRVFSLTALLVLVIAAMNYVNITTARSLTRAREVGVRKVMGALRPELFRQFLAESLLTTALAVIGAIMLAGVLLPLFSQLTGKEFTLRQLLSPAVIAALLFGGLLLSVLAGAYPAFVLSAYAPVKVLKGKLRDSLQGVRLRKTLIVAQFLISAILIVCTLMIGRQVDYVQSQNLGFDHRRLVSLTLDSASNAHLGVLKARLSSEQLITGATATYQVPIRITHGTAVSLKNETEKDRKILNAICVDGDFARVLELHLTEGSGLTPGIEQQESQMEILLNQSAAAFFGWSDSDAIGKELTVWGSNGVVKGVVEDFRFNSVHSPIKPLIVFSGAGTMPSLRTLIVSVQGDPGEVQQRLTQVWSEVNPDSPLIITHLEDQYASLYQRETRMKAIANVFSSLSIFISLMGLFGLASYLITQRTKELGIRKVLGASFPGLIQLVSRDFIGMVVTAYTLAAPICWLIMREWLSGFAEKISFEWWMVVAAAAGTTLLALGTIFYHAFTVSRVNPAETLRTE